MRRKKRNLRELPQDGLSRREFLKGASMAASTGGGKKPSGGPMGP
jgi:hypothetical protein